MPERAPPPADLAGLSLAELAQWADAQRLPPVARWQPALCGDSGMRIAADGTWFHEGVPIARPAMVRLFAGLLRREEDGYFLVTPAEKLSIAVERTPFVAVELRSEGEGRSRRLAFRLSTGEIVFAGPDHPLRVEDGTPVLRVRDALDAALARPVYYELAELALSDPSGLWADGVPFTLADA